MANGIKKMNEWIMKDGRTINITSNVPASHLEAGTLKVGPVNGEFKFVQMGRDGNKSYVNFNPNTIFDPLSILTGIIGDSQITTAKINNLAVTTEKLNNLAVTTPKIGNLQVTSEKLATNSVISTKIMRWAVLEEKIAPDAVTTTKVLDRNITSPKIELLNVLNEHIGQNEIRNEKLFNHTLEYNKIKPYTIRGGESFLIGSVRHQGQIAQHSLTDFNMSNECIGERALKANSVTNTKIKDREIYGDKIKELSVMNKHIKDLDGQKIFDESVSTSKLAIASVTTTRVLDKAITKPKLAQDIQTLMDEWIRVKPSQNIHGEANTKTAWVKGNLVVRDDASAGSRSTNLKVFGNANITGSVTAERCYNPVFADLAEGYIPLGEINPGEAVALSKEGGLKVEKLNPHNALRFLGFASDEYATCFGASHEELRDGKKIAVTLAGRIKVKLPDLEGEIGEYLCYSDGCFITHKRRQACSIGRLLENKKRGDKYVLCQIWA